MGRFDETVDSLLETYSKCLSLLKDLGGTCSESQPRQLRKCIRSDRSKVRRVYSSQLSLKGSQLETGDATARSSLRRVIKRLTSAMTRLLRAMTETQNPTIDYQSLRSLSSSLSLDAVKTINGLSRRLSSSSFKSNSASSKKSKSKKRTKTPGKSPTVKHKKLVSDEAERFEERQQTPPPASTAGRDSVSQSDPKKRVSMATVSSGSTQLGEVGFHKVCRRQSCYSAASGDFSMQPIYPLRPYQSKPKRRNFWRWFG
ncbi:uncharacterized protein CTRU02_211989 [Colletotrichum truncatum]|uniref:Uncharacterized protein n=1 Tax=Colletotrichum truncatum TaxID=5467 RepID=A0ACC3YMB6_COLTU|nr:uncharacterized protein CTRU02_07398 [Colletotrichum truncatum]KAF6791636.1 hypothetical protein CTRU02_07398 [Colletotrichum truncatum]